MRLTPLLWLPATTAGLLACYAWADPQSAVSGRGGNCLAVSPDLKYAVTQTSGQLILWNLCSGKEAWRTWNGSRDDSDFAAFAPNDKAILTKTTIAWKEGPVPIPVPGLRTFDRATGKVKRSFAIGGPEVRAYALSADGNRLLTGGDGPLNSWDIETGKKLRIFQEKHWAYRLALSGDGKYALSGDQGHPKCSVKLWDVASGKNLWTAQEHYWSVPVVAFSPDGRHVLSVAASCFLNIRDLQTGRMVKKLWVGSERGEGLWVTGATFTVSGRYVVVEVMGLPLQLWEVRTGKVALTFAGGVKDVMGETLVITPDGRHVAALSADNCPPTLWDLRTGVKLNPNPRRRVP